MTKIDLSTFENDERLILEKIDFNLLPKHIAIIMDGNGRWAKKRYLPRIMGHKIGVESVRYMVETCVKLQTEVLTLYAFSTENWKRPKTEVSFLMSLVKDYVQKEAEKLHKNNIKFVAIGRIDELPKYVKEPIRETMELTKNNTGLNFNIALNYSGRIELIDAIKKLIIKFKNSDIKNIEELGVEDISNVLYTSGLPDPDLLIRTSGEMRISNFLLWQIAYSEIYITDVYWPDFRSKELLYAIIDFQRRDRRYGGIKIENKGN